MSLSLAIKGIALRIYIETEAQMEHINPMLADGMEDGFSLPFELPALGNEKVLEYVHELPLHQRTILFDDATLGHAGIQLFPGTLRVLGSTKDTVRTNFTQEGFVERARSVMLPDTLRALEIDIFSTWYDPKYFPTYADGGPCRFPMHYNPKLYGSENPDWMPDAQPYSATQAYQMNQLVRFSMPADNVQREEIWQCTSDTTAGQSPSSAPVKWRRTAFGVVNAWDKEHDSYYYNGSSGNFYALVPWFYLKYVLHHALAHIGYRGIGDFVDDARTDEVCLPNSTTLDRVREINGDHYFRAQHGTGYTYDAALPGYMRLNAPTESPLPFQDAGDRWDTDTFTPDTAGTWTFRVEIVLTANVTRSMPFAVWLYNSDDQPLAWRSLGTPYGDRNSPQRIRATFTFPFSMGQVGQEFHFRIAGYEHNYTITTGPRPSVGGRTPIQPTNTPPFDPNGAAYNHVWPNASTDGFRSTDITGWLQQEETPISRPDQYIRPHRHVPNVSLLDFLLGVADAFNLELDPDHTQRTLNINYREPVVRHRHRHTTYHPGRLLNDVELDHTRAIEGARVKWDIDTMEEGLQDLNDAPVYDNEADVPPPYTSGMLAVLRNTREVLKSALTPGGLYVWNRVGYHHPPYGFGDADKGRTITPAAKPLQMVHKRLDGEDYMMPMMDEQGTSAWFLVEGDRSNIHLCEMYPTSSFSGDVTNVPGARSWGYGWTSEDRSRLTLELHNADADLPGMGQQYWHHWLQTLLYSEPVTIDLLLDTPFLLGKAWKRPMHMQGQEYLLHHMPVTYGREQGLLISEGAFALRLMPPREYDYLQAMQAPPEPFVCVGDGYVSLTFTGTIYLEYSAGYFSYRRLSDGSIHTADGVEAELTGPDTICIWRSHANGTPVEDSRAAFAAYGGDITGIEMSGLAAVTFGAFGSLQLLNTSIPQIPVPAVPGLEEVYVIGTTEDVILPSSHALNRIVITAALTVGSVNTILANLRDNNFSGECDLSGGINAAPTLQGIADVSWLISNGASITTN